MSVCFSRHDRLILQAAFRGLTPKELAGELEIAEGTARAHIRAVCLKAGVVDYPKLIVYVMQQPHAMSRGVQCARGLHPPGYVCACPYCRALVQVA